MRTLRSRRRFIPGIVLGALAAAAISSTCHAQMGAGAGMPYQRMSTGAADWAMRGGGYAWGPGFAGYPPVGGFGGFYGGAGFVSGSWYQRPYPYHLDYYKYKWGGVMTPAPLNCPCVEGALEQAPAPTPQ